NKSTHPDFALYFDATDISQSDLFLLALHLKGNDYDLIKQAFTELGEVDAAGIYLPNDENISLPYQIKKMGYHYCNDKPNVDKHPETQIPRIISHLLIP
ncbi:MAG: hypothetical protein LBQ65_03950, partial [Tannerellaceae bacterium]|nr:hypothetical protein [Tannerellaceae bacterium]